MSGSNGSKYDVVVIGGGHNGLVNAAYLARAGKKVLVLERRHVLGGAAVTEEIFPGFKFSVCSYVVSLLRPEIIRDLDLPRHGLEILPLDGTFTPMPNGDYLWRVNDHGKTHREIARHSRVDAEAYDEFGKAMQAMCRFVKPILSMVPPDPSTLDPRELMKLLFIGKRFQGMTSEDKYNQVQLMTMSAIDFLDQWFETDVLKATMSASGIIGTFLGVRSPGTAYVLLHHYMGEIDGAFRAWGFARGGTGAISNAIADAAREAGVEIRTQAAIAKILVKDGKAKGVVLSNGDEIYAELISSSVDPRLTFNKFIDAEQLPGDFLEDVNRFKYRGSSGKVNLALDALPNFKCMPGPGAHSAWRHFLLPLGRIHGARLRRREVRKFFAAPLYRHGDSIPHRSLGRATGQACNVLLRAIRALQAPPRLELGRSERSLRRQRNQHHRRICAEHQRHHRGPADRNAARSGARVRPKRRQHFPGRTLAGTAFLSAPGGRMGAFPHANQEPVHVRVGHSPGRRNHGRARPFSRIGNSERHRRLRTLGGLSDLGVKKPLSSAARKNMADKQNVVIIGGGHNGLVAAFYLAKAGFNPLVLERREQVGGAAITTEFHPGFRCSTLAHSAGPILPDIVRDLQLQKHGLQLIESDVAVTALTPDDRALILYRDTNRSAQEISAFSARDAVKYPEFAQSLEKMGKVIAEALATTPPDIDHPSGGDLWSMLKTGRAIRNLGKKDMYRLLRWGPMAVADLAGEFFETELLRAVVAARGVFGTFLGPWSAGSSLVLLIRAAGDSHPAGCGFFAAGGMGALTQAIASAAKAAGAEIRTGVEVAEIRVKDGAATGVVLSNGDEIAANAVISNCDPKRTLLKLTDPLHLSPDFVQKLQHYRGNGTVAKVNLALSGLPNFHRTEEWQFRSANWTHSHRSRDRLSGAGLRCLEIREFLAPSVP